MDIELLALLPLALIVLSAYTVFGMTGFGAAIVAVPLLVQFRPLAYAVPLMLLLDLVATAMVFGRNWRSVQGRELARLVPWMVVGVVLGAAALTHLDSRVLLLCLGVFVVSNALWSLASVQTERRPVHSLWGLPAGLVGGAFSAAFGTGGPIYTLYLVRRIWDTGVLRATIATTILISALVRFGVFGATGLLADAELLMSALWLAPFCVAGVIAGSALRRRFAPDSIRKLILMLLLLGGSAVIVRAFHG